MVNSVTLIGNIGKAPEEIVTPSGMNIATFSLATNKNIKRGDNWESKTTWHNIKAFNNQAEYCKKLKKGNRVYIEGELDYQQWEKEGKKYNRTEIIIHTVRNLSPKEEGESGQRQPKSQSQPKQNKPPQKNDDSEDLPF